MYNTVMNTICLSENANEILKNRLRQQKYELIEIKKTDAVYDSISSHCDIYLCKVGNELVVAPVQLSLIRDDLLRRGIRFFEGADRVGYNYPANIRYNAAQVGRNLIHDTAHTDPAILNIARELGMHIIHVKQGYTKCNLVVVDDNSVITSDLGLVAALERNNIDVLVISPGYIRLEGVSYGFLGGCTGRVDFEVIFNGDLSAHPDFENIVNFIRKKDLRPVWFEEYPLEDIGSIIQF